MRQFKEAGLSAKSGCVVVKVSKPHQDMRFDVPAVGIDTIKNLHAVGGSVLAVESGKTILLERDALLDLADRHGMSVVGVAHREL